MYTRVQKHSLPTRVFHWLNVAFLAAMLWSGLLIYWANPVYRVGLGRHTLIALFPDRFFAALGAPFRLAEGMAIHFLFMWLFAINGALFVAHLWWSGEWRDLIPGRHAIREAAQIVRRQLHLGSVEPPRRPMNGGQQIAYTTIIAVGAGSVVTGLSIYRPIQFGWLTQLLGGYEWARWEHFWLAASCVLFLAIHLTEVAAAGWRTFQAMVTGEELSIVSDGADRSLARPSQPREVTSDE
jgi:thiosulfate reductase cytochrome b subunit